MCDFEYCQNGKVFLYPEREWVICPICKGQDEEVLQSKTTQSELEEVGQNLYRHNMSEMSA